MQYVLIYMFVAHSDDVLRFYLLGKNIRDEMCFVIAFVEA